MSRKRSELPPARVGLSNYDGLCFDPVVRQSSQGNDKGKEIPLSKNETNTKTEWGNESYGKQSRKTCVMMWCIRWILDLFCSRMIGRNQNSVLTVTSYTQTNSDFFLLSEKTNDTCFSRFLAVLHRLAFQRTICCFATTKSIRVVRGYQQICCEARGRPEKPADRRVCVDADRKPSGTQSSDIPDLNNNSFSVSYMVWFRAHNIRFTLHNYYRW